jgi:hypothetical protein
VTRVYTPDATGRCTICSRPEAEHSRSGGWEGDEARCMPEPVEVTDAQIRDLRDSFDEADDPDLALACDRALGLDSLDDCTEDERLGIIETSRETCAAAINARAKDSLAPDRECEILGVLIDDVQAFGAGDDRDRHDERFQRDAINLLRRLQSDANARAKGGR